MRLLVVGVCLFAVACGQGLGSPISPLPAVAPTLAAAKGAELPFRGSLTSNFSGGVVFPILTLVGTGSGEATHLGRFSAAITTEVNILTTTGVGTLNLSAANGDELFATTVGHEDQLIEPGVSRIITVATIGGGTGRFDGASGTFTMVEILRFTPGAPESSSSGSFEGFLTLK